MSWGSDAAFVGTVDKDAAAHAKDTSDLVEAANSKQIQKLKVRVGVRVACVCFCGMSDLKILFVAFEGT